MSKKAPYIVYPGKIANQIVRELHKEIERKDKKIEILEERITQAIEYMNGTFSISSVKDMIEILDKIECILKGVDKQ